MATRGKGYLTRAGYVKASDWTTAVVCASGNGFEILSEGVKDSVELARDESFNGSPVPYPGGPGNETVDGPIDINLKYEDVTWVMIAQLMGTAGLPDGSAEPYTHELQLAADNDGKIGTLILDRGFEVWEFANVKPTKLTLAAALADQFVKATVSFLGYTRNVNTSTGTNNNTTVDSMTIGYTEKKLVKPGHLTVWLAHVDESGDFADGDKFCVLDFSLDVERVSEALRTTCTKGKQGEPIDNGFAKVTGKITLPAYEEGMASLIADAQTKAVFKMRWKFEQPSPGLDSIELNFPAVQLTADGPTASGPGRMPVTLNFDCFRALEDPDGMDHDLFYMLLGNARATDLLT